MNHLRIPLTALLTFLLTFLLITPAAAQYCPTCPSAGGLCPITPSVPFQAAPAAPRSTQPHQHPQQQSLAGVVRVVSGDGRSAGTGTLIAIDENNRGLILTAGHVLEGQRTATAHWPDGTRAAGPILCCDAVADIAAFVVEVSPTAIAIPLADVESWPPQGETVELTGYGGGNFRHWQATVNGYTTTGNTRDFQTLSLNTQTISGDSGGPVTWQGTVVGVIWGGPLAGPRGPMTATHATSCVRIRPILARHWPGLGRRACPPATAQPAPDAAPRTPSPLESSPPAASPPAQPSEQVAALQAELAALRTELAAVHEQLAAVTTTQGPRGPAGDTGPPGPAGDRGPTGPALRGSIIVRVEPVRRE